MPADDQTIETKLATMAQQMINLAEGMKRIETTVNEVVGFERTIATLQADYKHQTDELRTQWEKIDENAAGIVTTTKELDKWINTTRGAFWMLMLFATIFQGCVVGAMTWGFNTLQADKAKIELYEYRLLQIEQRRTPDETHR